MGARLSGALTPLITLLVRFFHLLWSDI
jgi:hypothetical protein